MRGRMLRLRLTLWELSGYNLLHELESQNHSIKAGVHIEEGKYRFGSEDYSFESVVSALGLFDILVFDGDRQSECARRDAPQDKSVE